MSTTKKMFTNSDYQGLSLLNVRSVNSYDDLAAITAATVTYALGVDDHGFRAYAKDTKKFYKWTGTALEEVPETSERITVLDNTLLSLQDVVDLGVDLRKNTLYKNEAGMIVDVTSEGTATLISDGVESGRIVFKPITFVTDTEVIFDLNADTTIDFQSGKAQAGSIQEVENKFLMATGIAVHYKDGTEHYLDSSSKVRVIDNETFGITLGISAEMVVSLEVNLKDVLPLNTGTLNTFTFNTGTAPTLVDFETAIGFALVDGFTDGTVVKFNNIGYTIADSAFGNNTDLLNIATAPNVTAGDVCFIGCTSLTSTGLITTAGNNCFAGCTSLTSTGLITTAGDVCFQNCTSLTSTGNVTTAGNNCFAYCTSLTTTGNVTTAGNSCFENCTSLTTTENVTTAGKYCFANCTSLTSTGNVTTTGNSCFKSCTSLTSTGLITTAGNNCFESCTSLTSTGNVTTAGDGCFYSCTSLTSTGNVTTAGNNCFENCTSLTNMDFTNCDNFGTTTGDEGVFSFITGLTINLTAKAIHQTSNGGSMEGDLAFLDANNTVTFNWV